MACQIGISAIKKKKSQRSGKGNACGWWVDVVIPILDQVIREVPPKWVPFDQRLVGGERASMQLFRERAFQKEEQHCKECKVETYLAC